MNKIAGVNSAYLDRVNLEIDHNISTVGYIIFSVVSLGIGFAVGLAVGLYAG